MSATLTTSQGTFTGTSLTAIAQELHGPTAVFIYNADGRTDRGRIALPHPSGRPETYHSVASATEVAGYHWDDHGTITVAQVERIHDLLCEVRTVVWYDGPVDPRGVEAMSREDASTYITALEDAMRD